MDEYKNVTKQKVTVDRSPEGPVTKVNPVLDREDRPGKPEKSTNVIGKLNYVLLGIWVCATLWCMIKVKTDYRFLYFLGISAIVVVLMYLVNRLQKRKKETEKTEEPMVDDTAAKIKNIKREMDKRLKSVKNEGLQNTLVSITITLDRISTEVDKDPKDRKKVRKLANYYGDMMLQLIDKYIMFQNQTESGENVEVSMRKIEEGLSGADTALKKTLNDLFADDAMEVSADISVLEQLMNIEGNNISEEK